MFKSLMVTSGVFWILTYLMIIKRGFHDRTFGMPLFAFCFNISWEFVFSFLNPHSAPYIYVNVLAFSLDIIILYQILRFWKNEFSGMSKDFFYMMFSTLFVTGFLIVYFTSYLLSDDIGFYIAFGQNLLMSILFVLMLLNRSDLRGQSIYIAIFKMLGTIFASLAFGVYDPIDRGSIFMNSLYVSIILFDLIYIIIFYQKMKDQTLFGHGFSSTRSIS